MGTSSLETTMKTNVDQHEFDRLQRGPRPPSSSPTNILACYLPFNLFKFTIKFIFTFETQAVQLSCSTVAQMRAQSVIGICYQASTGNERSRFTHRVLSGLRFWPSTVPRIYDTGWVCGSSAYLSTFIQLLFRSLTTLASLR